MITNANELLTRKGFTDAFWREKKLSPSKTHRQIFRELSQVYYRAFNHLPWNYEAFRKYRDRHRT